MYHSMRPLYFRRESSSSIEQARESLQQLRNVLLPNWNALLVRSHAPPLLIVRCSWEDVLVNDARTVKNEVHCGMVEIFHGDRVVEGEARDVMPDHQLADHVSAAAELFSAEQDVVRRSKACQMSANSFAILDRIGHDGLQESFP